MKEDLRPITKLLGQLFDDAFSSPRKSSQAKNFMKVSVDSVEQIKSSCGVDVAGYSHAIGNGEILKIIKDHGASKETLRGQIPVERGVFIQLAAVLNDPDSVEPAGKTKQGLVALRFFKRINGFVIVVEEVRTGRRQLVTKTLYMRKAGAKHAPEG